MHQRLMRTNKSTGVTVSGNAVGFTLSEDDFTYSQLCTVLNGAVCTEVAAGSAANFPGSSQETFAATDLSYATITITAGLEKISSAPSLSSSAANSGAKSSSSTGPKQTGSAGNSTTTPNSGDVALPRWAFLSLTILTSIALSL